MLKSLVAFGLIAGLAVVGSASAMQEPASPDPGVIPSPDWLRMPNADQVAERYPPAAKAKGVGGRAKVYCRVEADGSLSECKVIEECPAGLGFGKATLAAARYFHMRTVTADGGPVAGKHVVVPLAWRLAGQAPPPSCGRP